MIVEVERTISSRTVYYTLSEAEPLASRKWGTDTRSKRQLQPESASVVFTDGAFSRITLSGPRLVKSGPHDYMRETAQWVARDIDEAPEWVQQLAAQDAEEVPA